MKDLVTKIQNKQTTNAELKEELGLLNSADIAMIIEQLDDNAALVRVFKLLPKDIAAEVFAYLSVHKQEHLINTMTDVEIAAIISDMFSDDAVDMLEEMPSNIVTRVLKNADEQTRKTLNQLLNYPEDSAGSLMTTEFVSLKAEMSVAQAFESIRQNGVDKETIYTCYITTLDNRLEGVVSAKTLIFAAEDDRLSAIMEDNVISCNTHDDRETAASLLKKYDFNALPVVDKEGRLVGIITADDIMTVVDEENTEDIQKMAGLTPTEKPYLKTGVFEMVGRRIIWLATLTVAAILAALVMRSFDNLLSACFILIFSIPMLMDTGGNCGSQTSTFIIRGLSLGELGAKDVWKILWKEIKVAFLVGITLAPVAFLKVFFFDAKGLWADQQILQAALVGLTVVCALILSIITAKIMGCLLPLLAKKIKLDPTIMSTPLLTTIQDILTLLIYFGLASVMVL